MNGVMVFDFSDPDKKKKPSRGPPPGFGTKRKVPIKKKKPFRKKKRPLTDRMPRPPPVPGPPGAKKSPSSARRPTSRPNPSPPPRPPKQSSSTAAAAPVAAGVGAEGVPQQRLLTIKRKLTGRSQALEGSGKGLQLEEKEAAAPITRRVAGANTSVSGIPPPRVVIPRKAPPASSPLNNNPNAMPSTVPFALPPAASAEGGAGGEGGARPSPPLGPTSTGETMDDILSADLDDDEGGEINRGVRVIVRVRPLLGKEHDHQMTRFRAIPDPNGGPLQDVGLLVGEAEHRFQFDRILPPVAEAQAQLWQAGNMDAVVNAVLKGFNATVFAYGQTGSGKTYTMDGIEPVLRPASKRLKRQNARTSLLRGKTQNQNIFDPMQGGGGNTKGMVQVVAPPREREGVALRAIREVFDKVQRLNGCGEEISIVVEVSFLQIYHENVYDLLSPTAPEKAKGGLRVRFNSTEQFHVENLFKMECTNAEEARALYFAGIQKRIVASHLLNQSSSRSHTIFTLDIVRTQGNHGNRGAGSEQETSRADQLKRKQSKFTRSSLAQRSNTSIKSKLCLVDLAGSERLGSTGAKGLTMAQGIGINKSLFVLRKVIKALSEMAAKEQKVTRGQSRAGSRLESRQGTRQGTRKGKAKFSGENFIPYRDSTLTRLLKHSLGGNSLTTMFACVCPSDNYSDENLSTLNYAAMAKRIRNTAKLNEDPKSAMIRKLKAEVKRLQKQLAVARHHLLEGGITVNTTADTPGNNSSVFSVPLQRMSTDRRKQITNLIASGGAGGKSGGGGGKAGDVDLQLRFVDSVGLVKSLLAENAQLRNDADTSIVDKEHVDFMNLHLEHENQELRARIGFLEEVIVEGRDPERGVNAFLQLAGTNGRQGDGEGGGEARGAEEQLMIERLSEENARLKQIVLDTEYELLERRRAAAAANKGGGGKGGQAAHVSATAGSGKGSPLRGAPLTEGKQATQ